MWWARLALMSRTRQQSPVWAGQGLPTGWWKKCLKRRGNTLAIQHVSSMTCSCSDNMLSRTSCYVGLISHFQNPSGKGMGGSRFEGDGERVDYRDCGCQICLFSSVDGPQGLWVGGGKVSARTSWFHGGRDSSGRGWVGGGAFRLSSAVPLLW